MKIAATKKSLVKLPSNPGVYKFLTKEGEIIYIGKAKNLKSRLRSYFSVKLDGKTAAMVGQATHIQTQKVDSEFQALLLEAKLVRLYKPKYNIQLRDDKSPLYIVITKEEYPRVLALRQTQLSEYKSKYVYGPFLDGTTVKKVLRQVRKVIPFSSHKVGKRGCIYSQIGLCDPCPSNITNINNELEQKRLRAKYLKNIRQVKALLDGKIRIVHRELEMQMKAAASQNDFETAQKYKEKLVGLGYVINSQSRTGEYLNNPNLLEDIHANEEKQLRQLLAPYLGLKKLERIECYDVAHLAGSQPTASMVTFINGEADKNYYRHFRIRSKKGNDDYGSMREVLSRRSKHYSDPSSAEAGWGKPDLVIVDGGKGQVTSALEVFGEALPVVGLAKRFETLIIKTEYNFMQIRLKRGPALNLVQRMRDEAHRFARAYHHKLVSKNLLELN